MRVGLSGVVHRPPEGPPDRVGVLQRDHELAEPDRPERPIEPQDRDVGDARAHLGNPRRVSSRSITSPERYGRASVAQVACPVPVPRFPCLAGTCALALPCVAKPAAGGESDKSEIGRKAKRKMWLQALLDTVA